MRTLDYLPPEKRVAKAQETLDIYAPIAHRLGMGKLRGELEDLSFQYLYPDDYQHLKAILDQRRPALEADLAHVRATLEEKLPEYNVKVVEIQGRIKRLYSLYRKLKQRAISIDQVYDLMAVRIITQDIADCYAAVGVVHNIWKPIPGRFKDWIGIPRNNLYQSLHTSVMGDIGHPFEVQIRTAEMHKVAEEGIAAHWRYKEGRSALKEDPEAYAWLKRLVEWQQEVSDSREFLDELKINLYPNEVYAYTPKGKVLELPRGSCPIDFAYAIHSDIGHRCVGAKVNGNLVKLSYELKNGDVVEILTSPNGKPSHDWLKLVKTARARNKIRRYLVETERQRSLEIGRKSLEREADRLKLNLRKLVESGELNRVAQDHGYQRDEDLIAAIGYGKLEARHVLARFVPPARLSELDAQTPANGLAKVGRLVKKYLRLGSDHIQVRGVDDVLVFRARCCSPIRGEKIIGYITRGKGVAIHRADCPNAANLMINRERIIEVDWVTETEGTTTYPVTLSVTTENRPGILANVTMAVADIKTNIRESHAYVGVDGFGRITITLDIHDAKHLSRVMRAIRNVSGVISLERLVASHETESDAP